MKCHDTKDNDKDVKVFFFLLILKTVYLTGHR